MLDGLKQVFQERRMGWAILALVVLFMCASFTCAASFILIGLLLLSPEKPDFHLLTTTAIKGGFFLCVTSGLGVYLYRRMFPLTDDKPFHEPTTPSTHRTMAICLAITLLFPALILLPRLGAYPWIAPDEAHHLAVAQNLALHGVYASGNSESGFRLFDPYDSVGVPVIAPIAGAFKVFGVRLAVARGVVATYYLLLCIGLFILFLPEDAGPAAFGVLLATLGYGTIYLGRTLYGEAPALAFLVWGLLAWRHALSHRPHFWSLVAGMAFGLAILCKTIVLLSAFAFLAVILLDWLTERRLRLPQILWPAVGVIGILGLWSIIQRLATQNVAPPAGDTLGLYQHYLMFGWHSPVNAFRRFLSEPWRTLAILIALLFGLSTCAHPKRDPAQTLLVLLAIFYLFWWSFFTPCQIYRYSWWSYVIGGCFGGILCGSIFNALKQRIRFAVLANIIISVMLFLFPVLPDAVREITQIYCADETRDEYAVAQYLDTLPKSRRVLTTYYPLGMTLDFLTQRTIPTIETIPSFIPSDTLILVDTRDQAFMLGTHQPEIRFGRYAVLKGGTSPAK